MEEKYNAICIRAVPYKESDKMLTLFTLERGLVDCIARGVKKANAKLKFCAEPFCFAEYVVVEKQGRRTVVEANEIDGFYDVRLDVDKYFCASAVIEFLRSILKSEIVTYGLFLETVKTLKVLNTSAVNPLIILDKFILDSLKLVGYGISYDGCALCKEQISGRVFFDFDDCFFVCASCADYGAVEMRISTYKMLSALSILSVDDLKNSDLSAYSPIFDDLSAPLNVLKFFDFFLRDKVGINLKSLENIIGG